MIDVVYKWKCRKPRRDSKICKTARCISGTRYAGPQAVLPLLISRGFYTNPNVTFVRSRQLSDTSCNHIVTGGRVSRGDNLKYSLPPFGHHAMLVLVRFDIMQQYLERISILVYRAWYYSRSRWLVRTRDQVSRCAINKELHTAARDKCSCNM